MASPGKRTPGRTARSRPRTVAAVPDGGAAPAWYLPTEALLRRHLKCLAADARLRKEDFLDAFVRDQQERLNLVFRVPSAAVQRIASQPNALSSVEVVAQLRQRPAPGEPHTLVSVHPAVATGLKHDRPGHGCTYDGARILSGGHASPCLPTADRFYSCSPTACRTTDNNDDRGRDSSPRLVARMERRHLAQAPMTPSPSPGRNALPSAAKGRGHHSAAGKHMRPREAREPLAQRSPNWERRDPTERPKDRATPVIAAKAGLGRLTVRFPQWRRPLPLGTRAHALMTGRLNLTACAAASAGAETVQADGASGVARGGPPGRPVHQRHGVGHRQA